MIHSIHALILRRGNVVRSELPRPSTVARYLADVSPLADYQVRYWSQCEPRHVTAEGFLALYEAGLLPEPRPFTAISV